MEQGEMKKCPYCAEMIKTEAIKCRFCGSDLRERSSKPSPKATGYWYRVNKGKRIAGVCTGIAREFNSEQLTLPLRLFFILTTVFYGFGFIVYIVLWLLMPAPVDEPERRVRHKAPAPPVHDDNYFEPDQSSGHTREKPQNIALSVILMLAGAMLLFVALSKGHFAIPFMGRFGFPHIMPYNPFIWTRWFPGFTTMFILGGVILLLIGGVRFVRFFLGCGFIVVGSILLLVFVPFMPKIFLIPVFGVLAMVLIVVGGIKLIFSLLGSGR
ncbi:PspC domain-containing protein [bacterium]|nr:PspC domain-containing protein [bacterium]